MLTDNEVGSAGATGRGEANILVSGGHLAVELIRAQFAVADARSARKEDCAFLFERRC